MNIPYKRQSRQRQTGRSPCENGGKDWIDAAKARDTMDCPQSSDVEEERKDPFLESLEEMWPCWYLDFVLLASGIVRE